MLACSRQDLACSLLRLSPLRVCGSHVPRDQHCQKEGGRHVVRFWLLPCLETLVGGGSIKLP